MAGHFATRADNQGKRGKQAEACNCHDFDFMCGCMNGRRKVDAYMLSIMVIWGLAKQSVGGPSLSI